MTVTRTGEKLGTNTPIESQIVPISETSRPGKNIGRLSLLGFLKKSKQVLVGRGLMFQGLTAQHNVSELRTIVQKPPKNVQLHRVSPFQPMLATRIRNVAR